ncbi:MAG: CDP-diacylglycerol--serine O-phosphatidyltransferase [Deltaproteobacteria bacterium]|jgi:CDP-diacylglycerol--serine O-phosphatidyltransferase
MRDNPHKHRFSMLRTYTLADLFTLINAGCGTVAIFLCLNYATENEKRFFWISFILIPAALICDSLDGYVARRTGRRSLIGADLDSLADIVSFGVAPAVMGFSLGLRGVWDMLILTYFVVCGISRLARFNVTAADTAEPSGKVKYYEGTPIPSSIIIVILLGIAFASNHTGPEIWFGAVRLGSMTFHPFTLIYGLSGSAMIATFKVPKL